MQVERLSLYGFKWNNNSCAFDTVTTILLLIPLSLPQGLREDYFKSFGDLGKILTKIDTSNKDSLEKRKKFLINHFAEEFATGLHTSLRLVLDYVLKHEIDGVIRIRHASTSTCSTKDCSGLRLFLKSNSKLRYTPYIEHKLNKELMTLQEVLNDYYDDSVTCRFCEKNLNITRSKIRNPLVLLIDITNVTINDIDSEISFNSVSYTIYAVSYYYIDTFHFTAMLKINNKMYYYDGMSDEGKLSEVAQENFELTYKNSTLKANMLWYIKK